MSEQTLETVRKNIADRKAAAYAALDEADRFSAMTPSDCRKAHMSYARVQNDARIYFERYQHEMGEAAKLEGMLN